MLICIGLCLQVTSIKIFALAPASLAALNASWIERAFGKLPFPKTFSLILSSLGKPTGMMERNALENSVLYGSVDAEHFLLSKEGKLFFAELMGVNVKDVETIAYLLHFKSSKEDFQKRFPGIKTLPYGLMVQFPKQSLVYFLNFTPLHVSPNNRFDTKIDMFSEQGIYPDLIHVLYKKVLTVLFPPEERQNIVSSILSPLKAESPSAILVDHPLEILNLKHYYRSRQSLAAQQLFSSEWAASLDFQESVVWLAGKFKNKRVFELGVGTGINLIYALKFGAKEVIGTDLFYSYLLVTKWNIEYARETGQISASGRAVLTRRKYFPKSDIYLFNAPAVRKVKEPILKNVFAAATKIDVKIFLELFEKLKSRLRENGAFAVWRFLITPDAQIVDLSEEEKTIVLSIVNGMPIRTVSRKKQSKVLARKLLAGSGLHFHHISPDRGYYKSEIYYLRKAEQFEESL